MDAMSAHALLAALQDVDGRPCSELAWMMRMDPATARQQLDALCREGDVVVHGQGRARYYALAQPLSAALDHGMLRPPRSCRDPKLAAARLCHGHPAGRLGVALHDALGRKGWLETDGDVCRLTSCAETALRELGLVVGPVPAGKRCLDWSERRYHVGGALGRMLAESLVERGWVRRVPGQRGLEATTAGRMRLRDALGIQM